MKTNKIIQKQKQKIFLILPYQEILLIIVIWDISINQY